MHYELGELPKAIQKGWFITFDEPWKTPSGIQMALQRFYERDGILQIDDMPGDLSDKQIVSDPRTRLVLSDNVVGTGDSADMYGATMIQDGSTLNRMDVVIHMPYMAPIDELTMLKNKYPSINEKLLHNLINFGNLLRNSYESRDLSVAFSPRNLFAFLDLFSRTKNKELSLQMVVLNRYADDTEKALVKDHMMTSGVRL